MMADPNLMEPKGRHILEGDDATFICPSYRSVQWTFEGQELPYNVKAVPDTSSLYLSDVSQLNEGYYECKGYTLNNETFYSEANVQVYRMLIMLLTSYYNCQ